MTIKQNLVTGKGETFGLNLVFKDSSGTPIDLTGHIVEIVVSRTGSTSVGTYPALVDSAGHIDIKVDDEATDNWPVGKLSYYVNHTEPNGDEHWLLYGALTVKDGARV